MDKRFHMSYDDDKEVLRLIKSYRSDNNTVKGTYKEVGISRREYYRILDDDYRHQIQDLKKKGMSDEAIYKKLNLKEKRYYKLLNTPSSHKKKSARNTIYRNDPKYIRIDNYRELELYRGIIVEVITRINDSEELFRSKKTSSSEFTQIATPLMIDIQNIKDAMFDDKKRIKEEIKRISNSPESSSKKDLKKRLKDNDWAIRTTMRIFDLEEDLIIRIFKRLSIADYPSMAINYNYDDEPEKDYIDILNEEIDRKYQYKGHRHKRKTWDTDFAGRNTKLVKHYILKYIQRPLLEYRIDYSNTLLDEYNFQKVSFELDMAIPEETQQELIERKVKEIYSKKLPFNYSEFIARTLLKDIIDIVYDKVYGTKKSKRHKPLSKEKAKAKRVADMFFIYDLQKNSSISYESCAELLSDFYDKEGIEDYKVPASTIEILSKKISTFMEEFRKKYKIQPSLLYRKSLK